MDNFEKVEKLRTRANVSYEEAKAALEASNWDLLDAIVALEKQGRTGSPEQSSYSTNYEAQEEYVSVTEKVEERRQEHRERHATVRGCIRKFIRICKDNYFSVVKDGSEIIKVPLWGLVLVLLLAWKPVVFVMVAALFFGVRYQFSGKDQLKGANEFMENAGNAAEKIKSGFSRENDPSDAFEK